MTRCIALLRGINVGRAKRVPMADLRALLESLGFTGARTLLNSGNAVFDARQRNVGKIASAIESAIVDRFGFPVATVVLTGAELDAIIAENPLTEIANDPSRHLVAFAQDPASLSQAAALAAEAWDPDALAVGAHAAYLWCAGGILDSRLQQAFSRLLGDTVTARNWSTVLKLQAAAATPRP